MFSKPYLVFASFIALSFSECALGRERWLERDNRPVHLNPRRFGQQNPDVLTRLGQACAGQVCGPLAGNAVSTLLANAGECTQQDMADQIIDAAAQFDSVTQQNMIALAVEFRQVEKNTPPDFTQNPPIYRNSVFCQTPPKNSQLNGLTQAQDPANSPNVFFDPALGKSVVKGSQSNTFPFGTSGSASNNTTAAKAASIADDQFPALLTRARRSVPLDCSAITVSVSATSTVETSTSAVTVTVGTVSSSTATASNIGNFGKCSIPQIEFGVGFDGRKETAFQPVDKTSYNHGSSDDIDTITDFMCLALTNTCDADSTAKQTCNTAKAAADTATALSGAQADAFNAVFGIITNFASVEEVDDTGKVIPGTGSGSASSEGTTTVNAVVNAPTASAAASIVAPPAASTAASATTTSTSTSSGIGNFGKCTVPQIKFGVGFDNRKETSFEPVDQTSYPHGSAQNIDIITQFMCDELVNSCEADQTARNTCATAQAAADTKAAKTGAQADAFNAVFGIITDFAAVASVDDQGNVIAGTGSESSAADNVATTKTGAVNTVSAAPTSAAVATTTTTAAASSSGGNLQAFTGNLGGVTAPAVTSIGSGQFAVEGNSNFNNLQSALERSCDVQNNQCANAANASGNKGGFTVAACGDQQTQCNALAQQSA